MRILGTTVDSRTVERGEAISLNLKVRTFIGVPGFVLNKGHPTMVIPGDIPEASLQLLRAAYGRGLLTLGEAPIRNAPSPNDLGVLLGEIDGAPSPREVADALYQVSRGTRRIKNEVVDKPMMPSEVIQHLLDHEIQGQSRDEFVNWIADLRDQTPGHAPVSEVSELSVQVGLPQGAPGTGPRTVEQRKTIDGLF